jgi:hypothetical protein
MPRPVKLYVFAIIAAAWASALPAQTVPPPNYEESKVPHYTLPDPLVGGDGQTVTTAAAWREKRRPEIMHLFEEYVYGRAPAKPKDVTIERRAPDSVALPGKAIRREVTIRFQPGKDGPKIDLVIFLPIQVPRSGDRPQRQPVPIFLGLNFGGNHTIHSDPGVMPSDVRMPNGRQRGKLSKEAIAKTRGSNSGQWPLEKILARGYGVATAWYGDIEPDFPGGIRFGVRQLYLKPGQTEPADNEWGAIAAWAWGLSRIMDYLETDADVDARHVALIGHSRLGKTALWAGAADERFALVISNDSGCGGAGLARRQFGETPARISTAFPHWFCKNYRKHAFDVDNMPVDDHELLALIAPRPLYVAAAKDDLWADPRGMFLACKAADPVYRLLGTTGLPATEMPAVEKPVAGAISYHIRRGKHDVTEYDWQQYLDCADKSFK